MMLTRYYHSEIDTTGGRQIKLNSEASYTIFYFSTNFLSHQSYSVLLQSTFLLNTGIFIQIKSKLYFSGLRYQKSKKVFSIGLINKVLKKWACNHLIGQGTSTSVYLESTSLPWAFIFGRGWQRTRKYIHCL